MQRAWKRASRAWAQFGRDDPYWAVCSHAAYHAEQISEQALVAFFQTGEEDIARVFATMHQHVAPDFRPQRALDYGCGVGRLVIPLARQSREVVGVDVSPPMLELARRNCASHGVHNVEFALAGAPGAVLGAVRGDFDLVHSHLVFQHIPPRIGEAILAEILDRLRPDGVGALYFIYDWQAPALRRLLHRVRRSVPLANLVANAMQGRSLGSPMIPMYAYDLARVFALLTTHDCSNVYTLLLDTDTGHRGAYLFFRRRGSCSTGATSRVTRLADQ